jgi:thiamine pyrophosphate-dependent acetolactate synthase large subunit-like protein
LPPATVLPLIPTQPGVNRVYSLSSLILPKGALFTCGAGHFFSWVAMYTPLREGVEIQYSYGFGAVGQGLGVAIGTGAPDN